jgi:hypothetical protein
MSVSGSFAVLQKERDRPAAEPIRRAFRSFSHLTDADAVRLAANAQGILMRHLSADQARALQRSLLAEGVEATLVREDELRRLLPDGQPLNRIVLERDALMLFDASGRICPVAWDDLSLVAVGAMPHFRIVSTPAQRAGMEFRRMFGVRAKHEAGPRSRLETGSDFVLELIAGHNPARYEIQALEFRFDVAPNCPAASTTEEFIRLARELTQRAPRALLNRGANDVRDGVEFVRGYPSRQAFLDEITWLLWNAARHNRPADH